MLLLDKSAICLNQLQQPAAAGLVIISKDYHVLWANDFIKRYKGDTIGKLCYSTLNSLDSPCSDCGVAKVFAGKTTLDTHEYCSTTVSYTHLRAHETDSYLVCRLL